MKTPLKILMILIAVLYQQLVFAGGVNTNSPTNPSLYATIEGNFNSNNKSVIVKNLKYSTDNVAISQVVLNFENGNQQSFSGLNITTTTQTFSGTGINFNLKLIGMWVARGNNAVLTPTDSSGYGHYIKNFYDTSNVFNDKQTNIGLGENSNCKILICHIPPGNPDNQHTIYISCNALNAHQTNHGDNIGECEGGGVIPVELINFNAKVITPEMVQLNWTTASEVNNDYIAIEKTADLNSWENVCKVHGKGNSTEMNHYSCVDSNAKSTGQNTVYYRPKQVDFNGTYEYFNIIKLRLENAGQANEVESVYPNPATDRIKIQYNASENGIVKIRLMSIEGKAILVSSYNAKQGSQVVDIDLPENDLAKGLYVLEVESAGQLYRQKVYKL